MPRKPRFLAANIGDLRPKSKWSEELIQKTIKVWVPKMGRDPTREEAIEMLENVSGFFRVLLEWDASEKRKRGADNGLNNYGPPVAFPSS